MNYDTLILICKLWAGLGLLTFVLLQFVNPPYGRHSSTSWGPMIGNKAGWVIMELPSFLIMLYFLVSNGKINYSGFLMGLWVLHYFNRSFVFPLRTRTSGKKMPLIIALSAILFNGMNAGLNGYYLKHWGDALGPGFDSTLFWLGLPLFLFGAFVNLKSDQLLINLRKPGETGYKIPKGFLFDLVSCPNYLGEILQWTGFFVMAWNLPALSFLVWTLANLLPRAKAHHLWYKTKFSEYPKNRKVVFPWVW